MDRKIIAIAGATGSQGGRLVRAILNAVTPDAYRAFGFPGAEILGNMFQFKADFQSLYCGNRDLALSRALNPRLQTFGQWVAANKSRIPLD